MKNEKRKLKLKNRRDETVNETPEIRDIVVETVHEDADLHNESVVTTVEREEPNVDEASTEAKPIYGDLRDRLRTEQKPGVLFPHDSCVSTDLTPDLEAIALTQYTLKRGLKEFGNDGLTALGKEMAQLHMQKVA